jgi:hypothetical protein
MKGQKGFGFGQNKERKTKTKMMEWENRIRAEGNTA